MKIKILGTRAKIKKNHPNHYKHSGVLVDEKILFDVGEKEFLHYHPDAIFFSHFHPDHAWFVQNNEKFNVEVPVFGPEENRYIEKVNIPTDPVTIGDYKITPVPTLHSIKVKSTGFLIEHEEKRIFYSADVAWIEKQYHHLLNNLDLVITEGTYIQKSGVIKRKDNQIYGHTGIPNLINLFNQFTNKIVFMHLGTWFMKNTENGKQQIQDLQSNGINLDVAFDGKEYQV